MKNFYCLTVVLFLSNILSAQFDDVKPPLLHKGTVVKAKLLQSLNTKLNTKGEIIHFEIAEDVKSNGNIVIEKGTPVTGTIIICKKAKLAGTNGKLDFTMDYINLKDGRNLPLTASKELTPKEDKQIGVIAATALVHPLFVLIKGKDVIVEKDKIFEVYLSEDFR